MQDTRDIMGMPVSVEVVGGDPDDLEAVFAYFARIDAIFSTYKDTSEISRLNRAELDATTVSADVQEILRLAAETERDTNGYFNIRRPDGRIDPSGLVKGWAIREAGRLLRERGRQDFCLNVGGDVETSGHNAVSDEWTIGLENPFNRAEIIKVIYPRGRGVATSGHYIRGAHIYDPHTGQSAPTDTVSLTVIGPDVYEADRFATAAYAMGRDGIGFIERRDGLEGYMINEQGVATMTSGFHSYTQ